MCEVYELRIFNLLGSAEIALQKESQMVRVERLIGKVSGGPDYRRLVCGEPGLTAVLKSGQCSFGFSLVEPKEARINLSEG
ncbi:hypothetical protein ACOAOW_07350 [Pseudomonas aeruginosa]|uniref:hypothetical protein n=1 Tax=Pseudomonas aeruginosa TaxID=287 RepID=UPI0003B9E9D6|nr:hypothetical protein [Pseudomonas aeruginosa]EKQ6333462.1 hypothetical protein [Pseudomonas aeruginosa]EKV8086298.1 hypothetical protein [Pseudomonas aeruginosa]ERY75402.1 hypothetical protein Q029_02233 [Pseudomonas aeruginosa BWHPSA016]MBH3610501.1 hypothetical protein [Pseudomonas aeruginosa]MCS9827577.1 hypothetical protein [Pseudomonas aeruginosa]